MGTPQTRHLCPVMRGSLVMHSAQRVYLVSAASSAPQTSQVTAAG